MSQLYRLNIINLQLAKKLKCRNTGKIEFLYNQYADISLNSFFKSNL